MTLARAPDLLTSAAPGCLLQTGETAADTHALWGCTTVSPRGLMTCITNKCFTAAAIHTVSQSLWVALTVTDSRSLYNGPESLHCVCVTQSHAVACHLSLGRGFEKQGDRKKNRAHGY